MSTTDSNEQPMGGGPREDEDASQMAPNPNPGDVNPSGYGDVPGQGTMVNEPGSADVDAPDEDSDDDE